MSTIFTKIVRGEIPSYKVAESEDFYAFLDINPLEKGHTLVIPKKEVDYIFDLQDTEFSQLFLFARRVAKAIKKTIPCSKVGVAVIGLEVAHAHIHLVPINGVGDLDFKREKLSLSSSELKEISESISNSFKELQ